MSILAAIDIGSNAMRMKIAHCPGMSQIHTLAHERLEVRLGTSAFGGKSVIDEETTERAVNAIRHFKEVIDAHHAIAVRAVATSALREADNRRGVVQAIREETGVEVEVISGAEEARLIQLGAQLNNPLDGETAWFIDIGGGSTEVSVGDGRDLLALASMRLGAVRLTNMFVEGDPLKRTELRRLIRFIHDELDQYNELLQHKAKGSKIAIGTGGCASALISACYPNFNSGNGEPQPDECSRKQIHRLTSNLINMSRAQREELSGITSSRAEIIVAGAVVMRELMDELGIETLRVTDRGLRDGILVDLLERGVGGAKPSGRIADRRAGYVRHIAKKFGVELPSAYHCANLSCTLFDALQAYHDLDPSQRDRLQAAAILRETGKAVSFSSFHKHSQYIISQSELLGYTRDEIHDIALIARYHRKAEPANRHREFAMLSSLRKHRIRWLAAIMRVADALDVRRQSRVSEIRLVDSPEVAVLEVVPHGDVTLERWSAEKALPFLAKMVGKPMELKFLPA